MCDHAVGVVVSKMGAKTSKIEEPIEEPPPPPPPKPIGTGPFIYVAEFGNDRVTKWREGLAEGIVVAGGNGRGVYRESPCLFCDELCQYCPEPTITDRYKCPDRNCPLNQRCDISDCCISNAAQAQGRVCKVCQLMSRSFTCARRRAALLLKVRFMAQPVYIFYISSYNEEQADRLRRPSTFQTSIRPRQDNKWTNISAHQAPTLARVVQGIEGIGG